MQLPIDDTTAPGGEITTPSNSAGRRSAAALTAAVAFVALWFVFAQITGWLFASDVGQITKLLQWAVFNLLGGAIIHLGIRKLAEIIAHDYSRKLLTGVILSVGAIFIAVIIFALLGTNSASGNLLLVWTGIGVVAFLAGAVTETIWSRQQPSPTTGKAVPRT